MVIFLFLRSVAATIIPSVAVPLSLVGTFGVMYLLGYSLNNLSLMALTISTGFVVDDAIVMIENIARYIEEGESPLEAALKGSEQIGFTIVSLTVSLIAVLIPLLFMGDIVGRLFREFADHARRHDPGLGGRLADADADDVRQAAAPQAASAAGPLLPRVGARLRARSSPATARRCSWVLRHQPPTLLVAVGHAGRSRSLLYIVVPKGFFPVQDTGVILGISEAPQTVSFAAMAERQQALAEVILQDPAVESLSSFIGVDGTNTTLNSGRIQINLKPLDERDVSATRRHSPPAAEAGEGRRASRSSCSRCRTSPSRTASAARSSSTASRMPTPTSSTPGRRGCVEQAAARCRSCATSPATSRTGGLQAAAGHRSRHRLAARHHAADDRRHALRRLRPAAGLDDLHAAQPVPRGARGRARVPARTREALEAHLRAVARPARRCRSSAFTRFEPTHARRWRSTTRDSSRW